MEWIKQLFCKHNYQEPDSFRGFFGILQCQKCRKWSQVPFEEMATTHINFNKGEMTYYPPTNPIKEEGI